MSTNKVKDNKVKEKDVTGNEDDDHEEAFVRCGTSSGELRMRFYRKWSPNGYDRAVELFEAGFYDQSHFYRVVPHFLVQFGISYSPDRALIQKSHQTIQDDPQLNPPIPFEGGTISFAGNDVNSRTSQLFIAYEPAKSFGTQLWETPIGKLADHESFQVAKSFYSYGDMPPWGHGPVQGKIHAGPDYIRQEFPQTDHFTSCSVERISTPANNQRSIGEKKEADTTAAKADHGNAIDDEIPRDDGVLDDDNGEELENPQERAKKPLSQLRISQSATADSDDSSWLRVTAVASLLVLAIWWRWIWQRGQQNKARKSS